MAGTTETLLTAEEFARLPDEGRPTELVRGRLVAMNPPFPRHGQVCSKVARIVGAYADQHNLGHVLTNDSAVVTRRGPDSVRGAAVAFYSYAKVSRGPLPKGYLPVPPDLVFEVLSSEDRWNTTREKVSEYIDVGVRAVGVLDPSAETVHFYHPDTPEQALCTDDDLAVPEVLGEFRVRVGTFFE